MLFKPSINLQIHPLKASLTMKNDKACIKPTKTFQKSQIQIKSCQIDEMLHVYSWRSKSELPIVKVLFYKVLQKNLNHQYATVEVSHQNFVTSLKELSSCTLENTLYLIEEAFTGFHGLFKMFGPFIISSKMIVLNKSNRCKVWINQNFSINQPISVQIFKNQTQKVFFNQLITIFQSKCSKSQNSNLLFTQLLRCENFEQIFIKISQFTKKFKIQSQKNYKFQQNPQKSESQCQSPTKFISNLKKSEVSKKVPAFLNKTIVNQALIHSSRQLKVQPRLQKSRSTSRSIVRSRTPLTRNRSQLKLCSNPLKSFIKAASPTIKPLLQPTKISDYSFERQNDNKLKKSFIPKTIAKHTKTLSSFLINRTQSDDTYHDLKALLIWTKARSRI